MASLHGGWGGLTPSELLEAYPVQTINGCCRILNQERSDGSPYRTAIYDLIRDGSLKLVDPSVPMSRWTVATVELRRYLADGPHPDHARNADAVLYGRVGRAS